MSDAATAKRPTEPEGDWTPELNALGMAFRRVFRTLNRMRGRDTHLGGSELSHAQFELLLELELLLLPQPAASAPPSARQAATE